MSCIGEGCDFCGKGKKPSLRVAINFFQLPEKSLKVIEQGRVWFKDLLKVREKYGVEKWTFEIERHGASGDTKTTYTILPEEKISFELQSEIAKLELHDLERAISGDEKKEKFESYDKSKGETTQEPLINPQLASELIPRLKALPRSEVDELCAKFGVQRIRDVQASDAGALVSFVESLEARLVKAQGKPAGEVDPFA